MRKVGSDRFGLSDSSAEKREDFGWDLFSLHRHFAEPPGAILLFRFRQRGAADNYSRFIFRCLRQFFEALGEVYSIADDCVVEPLFRAHVAGNYNTSVNSNADTDRGQAALLPLLVQLIERRGHL